MSKKILVVTGGIGAGKTSFVRFLKANGYPVLDADSIAKELLYGKYLARTKVILGDDITNNDGTIKKDLIRSRIFESNSTRENLNALTRDVVIPEIIKQAEKIEGEPCFVEMALLFEFYGKRFWYKYFSGAIAICCEESVALLRMKIRNPDISDSEAKKILDSQLSYKIKLEWADISFDTTHMKIEDYEPLVTSMWPKKHVTADATL